MKLPSDYFQVVRLGATTLRALGTQLREVAARESDMPELWLSVRDLEGLAGRLGALSEWEWRHGFASGMFAPQDFGVLDELIAQDSPGMVLVSEESANSLSNLREFLCRYCDRQYEFDDEPAAYERPI